MSRCRQDRHARRRRWNRRTCCARSAEATSSRTARFASPSAVSRRKTRSITRSTCSSARSPSCASFRLCGKCTRKASTSIPWYGPRIDCCCRKQKRSWIMAYSDKVLDHYENPRNVGSFAKDADDVGTGMVGAPACGDVMKLQIKVGPDGRIEDAKFKTYGCGSAIASSSLVTEWVKGKTLDQAMTIKNTHIAEELALPPVKIHCSILAEDAIKAAVADYKHKHGADAAPTVETQTTPAGTVV